MPARLAQSHQRLQAHAWSGPVGRLGVKLSFLSTDMFKSKTNGGAPSMENANLRLETLKLHMHM